MPRSLAQQSNRSLPIIPNTPCAPDLSGLPEPAKLKSLAGEIRQHTLDHLDLYLEQTWHSVTNAGGNSHLAATIGDAWRLVSSIAAQQQCQRIRHETSLLTDAADFVAAGSAVGDNTSSDALVTGANFAIAETGQVCICREIEFGDPPPRILICVIGIESIVPRLADLAVMLKLFARGSIGKPMPEQVQLLGARSVSSFHLIFLDDGRRRILAGEHRPVLRCIGCGACSAVCPVYQELRRTNPADRGSPIAAILSPLLKGLPDFDQLPFASSLCGACSEICPVGIDLPWHLVRLRDQLVKAGRTGCRNRLSHRLRKWVLMSPARCRRFGTPAWKLGTPANAPPPAGRSFRSMWKRR